MRLGTWAPAPDMAPAQARGPPRFTLVSDLDGTLVDPDDPSHAALRRFNALWTKYCAADCRLVYSTGRSHKKFAELRVRHVSGAPRGADVHP